MPLDGPIGGCAAQIRIHVGTGYGEAGVPATSRGRPYDPGWLTLSAST
jgi:hypothetical protein